MFIASFEREKTSLIISICSFKLLDGSLITKSTVGVDKKGIGISLDGLVFSTIRDSEFSVNGVPSVKITRAPDNIVQNNNLHLWRTRYWKQIPYSLAPTDEERKQTKKAMEDVGGKETNTAFNLFRYSGFANHLDGAKDTLRNLASCLPDTDEFKKLKSHLQPRGFWGRLFRFGNPKNEMNKLLGEGKIDKETPKIPQTSII